MGRFAHASAVRLRAALLWLTMTTVALGLGRLCLPEARALLAGGPDFTDLLVRGCAGAALVAAGWLWLVTTQVVATVVRAPGYARSRRVGPVRSVLLAACGVAALTSTTTAATAQDGAGTPSLPARLLDGLPLPDRATGALPREARPGAAPETDPVVRVRPGDSLWAIAARQLGPTADAADVASYWRRIHDLNAAVIGPNPDLVLPGQQLRLPHI